MSVIEGKHEDLISAVQRIDSELTARPYASEPDAGTFVDISGARVMGYQPGSESLSSYAEFEDTFRGSEAFVSTLLKGYLPILEGQSPVLDIGCGRGELLAMLGPSGVEAFGVDLDESMLQRCKEKGLDARSGDGIAVLRQCAPGSLGGVTAIQVVEHINPDRLAELFDAAFSALRPGGVLLLETVNPHSPAALKAFWLDLTHVRPLYPESLLTLARQAGFESARIVFPNGSGDLDEDLRQCGSYAVVAYR